MKNQMLYREFAKYYDLIYSRKDYKKEANKIDKLIHKYKKSSGKSLLEIACGTGNHLRYFRKKYFCTGTDLSQGMLAVARKKIKGVAFRKANMINFNLHKTFDIIVCLFSSIGYVKTYGNLRKTIKSFSRHMKQGGVVIIEPWFTKEVARSGRPMLTTYNGKNIKLARVGISKIVGNISVVYMSYLVGERNKPIKYFAEEHELGLFSIRKTLQLMREAGLRAKFLKRGLRTGRGLYVGVKI